MTVRGRPFRKLKQCQRTQCMCLVGQLCLTLCDPMDCSLPGFFVYGASPGKKTGVGCHALLQGIFPTQILNPGLLYCRQILYHLSHQGSPKNTVTSENLSSSQAAAGRWTNCVPRTGKWGIQTQKICRDSSKQADLSQGL